MAKSDRAKTATGGTEKAKKRNRQDSTILNVRAANKRLAELERRVRVMEKLVKTWKGWAR